MRVPAFLSRLFGSKALTITRDGFMPRDQRHGRYAYGRDDEGFDSNVVMAPVLWIMRTFTEARARVERRTTKVWDFVEDHPMERLIDQPNEFYDGDTLWKATVLSFVLQGNAYWRKIRNEIGDVVELWYTPHWMMKPHAPDDGSTFLDYYEYHHGYGPPTKLLPEDVVHFRFGLDPRDMRCGFSPLRPLLREVMTDNEAAEFSYTILENMGIPGAVVSPKTDTYSPSPAEVEKLKDYLGTEFTGQGRGKTLVFGTPTEITTLGFDPTKLTLGDLRNISEERVCAILGIPAAIVGFGSGLETAKVGATMGELRELAWVQCIHPMQKSMGRQLTKQLLNEFQLQTGRFRLGFDLSDAATFQESATSIATRVATLVGAGVLRVDQAQGMAGIEVDDTQKLYLRSFNLVGVGPDAAEQNDAVADAKPAPVTPAPSGSGSDGLTSGKADTDDLMAIALRRGFIANGKNHHD